MSIEGMLFRDFEWNDILEGHFLFSLFTCVVAVIVTCIVSWKFNSKNPFGAKSISNMRKDSQKNVTSSKSKLNDAPSLPPSLVKKSPALAAETVIQANMTEEQRKLEYEVRQKQLAQIHELMMKQSDKFGKISLSDVQEQMKLYQSMK